LIAAGAAITAAAVAWTFVSAAASGGEPAPVAVILGMAGAIVLLSHAIGRFRLWIVPAAIVGGAVATGIVAGDDLLSHHPLSGPFGYVNARSMVFMLGAIGGGMLAAASRSIPGRVLGLAAGLAFAVVPFASRTVAAAGLLVAAPALALLLRRRAVQAFALIAMLVVGGSVVIGATYRSSGQELTACGPQGEHCSQESGGLQGTAVRVLGEARPRLWREALVIAADHPLTGAGPGRFDAESRTAKDPDLTHAHNVFLQQAAEGGLPALILMLALFAWGFGLLSRAGGPVAGLAAAGLAATVILGSIDYVLPYPAVVAMAAAIVGSGSAAHSSTTTLAWKEP
jgi:O-antigen ligase